MDFFKKLKTDAMAIGIVIVLCFFVVIASVRAGSLSPSASPASTFYTLKQIYDPIASTSYDSSGLSASANGSLIQIMRYISANITASIWTATGNVAYTTKSIQVGEAGATVSYSRFDTAQTVTGHSLSTASDVLISGKLEVDSTAFFDGIGAFATRVGIGTSAPSTRLDVKGTASASYGLFQKIEVGGFTSASYSRFGTAVTSHAGTISAGSDLLISGGLEVNGSVAFDGFAYFGGSASISGNVTLLLPPAISASPVCFGGSLSGLSTLGTCSSSRRYKEDIQPLQFSLANVYALQPVNYKWINRDERSVGFIAEDVVKLIPELVLYNQKGEVEGINYSLFAPYFVAALKNQEARLRALEVGQGAPSVLTPTSDTIINAAELHVKYIEADQITVQIGITIPDQSTGEPYCVTVNNAQLQLIAGACGMISATPTPTLTPEVSPSVTASSSKSL